jgi:hypothetical protein
MPITRVCSAAKVMVAPVAPSAYAIEGSSARATSAAQVGT